MGNATDAAFVTGMTAHHKDAIVMGEIARKRAQRPQIRRLAGDIIAAQNDEISTLASIRDELHSTGAHGDADMSMLEGDAHMDMDPRELRTAKPFDRAFIDMMVPHHEGAIAMAEELLDKGEHPALREMAQDIIRTQSAEIDRMRGWRKAWYGSDDEGAGHSMDMGG